MLSVTYYPIQSCWWQWLRIAACLGYEVDTCVCAAPVAHPVQRAHSPQGIDIKAFKAALSEATLEGMVVEVPKED